MSEQTKDIFDEDNFYPVQTDESGKKNKMKRGSAIGAGAVVGLGAVAYDAFSGDTPRGDESVAVDLVQDHDKPDSTSANTADLIDSSEVENQQTEVPNHNTQPEVTLLPDHINILNAPDSMSFEQAFDYSRENLGSGALFEWQGHLYHTCHPNEYSALPDELKNTFGDLWLANEIDAVDIVPEKEGEYLVMNFETSENPDNAPGEVLTDTTSHHENAVAETESDSTAVEVHHGDIVYSTDDFDSDFDGLDEWVNPDDVV